MFVEESLSGLDRNLSTHFQGRFSFRFSSFFYLNFFSYLFLFTASYTSSHSYYSYSHSLIQPNVLLRTPLPPALQYFVQLLLKHSSALQLPPREFRVLMAELNLGASETSLGLKVEQELAKKYYEVNMEPQKSTSGS